MKNLKRGGRIKMVCPHCGEELVFVFDGCYHVFHASSSKVNLSDRDIFRPGAVIREPSLSTARRLISQLTENDCPAIQT